MQDAYDGSELHAKANVPLDPLLGASVKVNPAVCPLETVWLDGPLDENVKSKPMPENAAVAFAASDGLETVRTPLCCPAVVGEKTISAVQLAPGSSEAPHVVDES